MCIVHHFRGQMIHFQTADVQLGHASVMIKPALVQGVESGHGEVVRPEEQHLVLVTAKVGVLSDIRLPGCWERPCSVQKHAELRHNDLARSW